MVDAFISDPAHLTVHDSGMVKLPSRNVEVTKLPIFDHDAQLMARLGPKPMGEWLASRGMRHLTYDEYLELRRVSLFVDPFFLPTPAMTRAAGIRNPYDSEGRDTPEMARYRAENMRSRAWCAMHDEEMFERLAAVGWDSQAVFNFGKHPGDNCFIGWAKRNGKLVQNRRDFPHGPEWTSYAATSHGARDLDDDEVKVISEPPAVPRTTRPGDPDVAAVKAWQQYLRSWFRSRGENALPVYGADGDHGTETEEWTNRWRARQVVSSLPTDPDRAPISYLSLVDDFIEARNFTSANRDLSSIQCIVLHSVEQAIRGGVARNVAGWFGGPSAPQSSAHFVVGPSSVFQCVELADVAWAAPGMNKRGIQIEMVGQAAKTNWFEDGGRGGLRVVERTAELVAALCDECSIPVMMVDAAGLKAGARGVTSHASVTEAFGRSTHVDPAMPGDRRWDWPLFLQMVKDNS